MEKIGYEKLLSKDICDRSSSTGWLVIQHSSQKLELRIHYFVADKLTQAYKNENGP